MNRLYQRTFDQVHMSEIKVKSLREELSSRCSTNKLEDTSMNKRKHLRRSGYLLVAAILIASLTMTALACGGFNVIYEIITGEARLPVGSEGHDLTEQQPFEIEDYQYTEQDGHIIVDLEGVDLPEADDVSYDISAEEPILPGNSMFTDLTGQEAFEIEDYQYIEQDGQIIVTFDNNN